MIQKQPIQLSNAVEIPSSGSARLSDDTIANTEMAVAVAKGRIFFMAGYFVYQCRSTKFKNQSTCFYFRPCFSLFHFFDISTKIVRFCFWIELNSAVLSGPARFINYSKNPYIREHFFQSIHRMNYTLSRSKQTAAYNQL